MGNLRSVEKAFLEVGGKAIVTSDKGRITRAQKLVLPGVGAFGDGIKELKKLRLVNIIKSFVNDGMPFFGICLGMQLLFETSEEAPGVKGLGIFKGKVKKISPSPLATHSLLLKVPHMGWNQIKLQITNYKLQIFKDIPGNSYVYFVHSYYCEPKEKNIIAATTKYETDFASAVCKDNIWACQFHPEKSQSVGLKIMENFVRC
jgi:glutamine amidotransferase